MKKQKINENPYFDVVDNYDSVMKNLNVIKKYQYYADKYNCDINFNSEILNRNFEIVTKK